MNTLGFTQKLSSYSQEDHRERGIIYQISLYSVLFFIFLIPWGDGVFSGLVRIFGILSFAMASLLVVTTGTHRNYTFFHLFILILWAWVIFSVAWTPDLKNGLFAAPRLFQIMLLPFLFTLIINSKRSLILSYQSYIIGNIVGSSIIISNYLNGIMSPNYNRYTIANIETDSMSIILALAIPMAAYVISKSNNKLISIIFTLSIPYLIFAIFLTGTRTGFIVSIIGILYWLFTQRKASIFIKISLVIAIMLSIIVVAQFAPKESLDRVFSAGKSIKSGDLNYRTVIWSAAISEWKQAPLVGTGLGGLGYALGKRHVNYDAAHNTHIHILTENGLIGFFLYLLVEISILLVILKAKPFPEKVFLITLFICVIMSQLTLHTHMHKETWFAFTMLVIHGMLHQKPSRPK